MPCLLIVLATPKGHPAASTINKISSLGRRSRPRPHAEKRYLPLYLIPALEIRMDANNVDGIARGHDIESR